MEVEILKREGGNFDGKREPAKATPTGPYTQSDSAGGRSGTVQMQIGVY